MTYQDTGIIAHFESNECEANEHDRCAELYEAVGIQAKCTCSCHKDRA
jgi:hypothetical protein